MKNTTYLLSIGILCSIFLFSCRKYSTNSDAFTTYSSMDEVFSELRVNPKIVMVNVDSSNSFYGNSGTRYFFDRHAFVTATGINVIGLVQFQVAEYLQKGDMIFSKMLPISDNEPLLSGGEINVSAAQNGVPVYLARHNYLQANVPFKGIVPTGMDFFSGQQINETSTVNVNWIMPTKDSSNYNAGFVEIGADTLSIISDSLKMCNADAFITDPNFQTFSVTATCIPSFGTNKIYGYALYDDYKGVWPLGLIGHYLNGVFTEQHVPNIPVHFAVFTLINGNFYGGVLGATPTTGSNYTVNLTEQVADSFKAHLNNL